ncbi:MAG: GNAT family N-acetyltransferase [Myxococcales bacterium]|nr:GNAT family N-acetyltransferase [Myxococcales bacterium]
MATQTLTLETRRASLSDASSMSRLSMQLGYDSTELTMRQRMIRVRDDVAHAVFVAALEGDEVVGWVHVTLRNTLWSEPFAEIVGLVVDTNHRRLGVGRALVERVVAWSEAMHVQDLRARAQEHREDALAFYEGLGFELYKEQQVYRRVFEPAADPGGMPTLVD